MAQTAGTAELQMANAKLQVANFPMICLVPIMLGVFPKSAFRSGSRESRPLII
jgi:hypothetical protein